MSFRPVSPRHRPGSFAIASSMSFSVSMALSRSGRLPLHLDVAFLAEAIVVKHLAARLSVLVEFLCDLHVETTILGNLHQLAFFPPTQRRHAIGHLGRVQSRHGQRFERGTVTEFCFEVL